jgi:hypothetical protein
VMYGEWHDVTLGITVLIQCDLRFMVLNATM